MWVKAWFFVAAVAAAQPFDSFSVSETMVVMRDGVKLATDVYRPARQGTPVDERFPVLVTRSPYNKEGARGSGEYFARRGYVVVAQDCRGRFRSEGSFYAFVNEGLDGYDTIEWAAAQPFSNGKVGTFGGSYLGWDQLHAAMYRPPHLSAMFVVVAGSNFYQDYAYPGGAPNLGWSSWLLSNGARTREAPEALARLTKEGIREWYALPPAKRGEVFTGVPEFQKMFDDYFANPVFNAYWRQRGFYNQGYYSRIKDVPTFFVAGWYDYFGEGTLDNFAALSRRHKTPKKLVMGPWPHGVGRAECGDANFGPEGAVDLQALMLDWFDCSLKDASPCATPPEAVRLFRMGGGDSSRDDAGRLRHGGEWQPASGWPVPGTRAEKHFLHAGGSLRTEPPAADAIAAEFVFDPDNPVPTIGGRYTHASPPCAQNQVPLNDRPDVISYVSAPLEAPLEVTGKVRATLYVSSDAPDTDFTAKLIDVYPDGYALILLDGVLRARYRDGFQRAKPMKPGQVYRVTIDLGSTSNLFAAGHRIRLDVSSSNYPRVEPNPNTWEPAGAWTRRVKARNTIHQHASRASYVELPVAPR